MIYKKFNSHDFFEVIIDKFCSLSAKLGISECLSYKTMLPAEYYSRATEITLSAE